MSKHNKSGHGFSDDPEKVNQAGRKGNSPVNLKVDRADKARVGGQHSNGGSPRRGEG
jgi:general stress protein YciG